MDSFLHRIGTPSLRSKRVDYVLSHVYGISTPTARKILNAIGLLPSVTMSTFSEKELRDLSNELARYSIADDLKAAERELSRNKWRVGLLRQERMSLGLPVNGQRTKSNAMTPSRRNKSKAPK